MAVIARCARFSLILHVCVVLRYMEMDIALYEKCSRENNEKIKKQEAEREAAQLKWQSIADTAKNNGIDVNSLL